MGTLSNMNGITEPQIPSEIARDTEVASAIATHASATDPHPIYLTQTEGDNRYRQSAVALADADIPAAIARDTEVTSAIATHASATDPHPSLWTRITNTFLRLAGGQQVVKNNPAIANDSFLAAKNHLELATNDGSNPILGFHRAGASATSLYHKGYGDDSLRVRNADGFDGAIIHDGNIATKTAGNANNLLNLLGSLVGPAAHWNGTYRWRHLGGWGPDDNAILVHRAFVADRAANADFASIAAGARLDDNATGVKTKLVQGTTAAAQGQTATIPHGLDFTKMLSVQVVVKSGSSLVPEAFQNGAGASGGFRFSWAIVQGDLYIHNVQGESVGLLSKPFFALITYLV